MKFDLCLLFIMIFPNTFLLFHFEMIYLDLLCPGPFEAVSLVNSFHSRAGMLSPSQVWIRLPLNSASF